jgi:hypothetical protein
MEPIQDIDPDEYLRKMIGMFWVKPIDYALDVWFMQNEKELEALHRRRYPQLAESFFGDR